MSGHYRRRKRVSVAARPNYSMGRATPAAAEGQAMAEPREDDAGWGTYAMCEWLAHTWAPAVDERIDTIMANTYDLADRVNLLVRVVVVALVTTIAALTALVAVAVLT